MPQLPQREEMTRLGFYGLIPFVAGAIALWLSPWIIPLHIALDFHQIALVYGGVIVVYLAGVNSGAILTPKLKSPGSFLPGQLMALVALFAVMPRGTFFFSLGAAWSHLVILILLIYLLMRDLAAVSDGILPRWYGTLRTRLTFWAGLSILMMISRLLLMGFY